MMLTVVAKERTLGGGGEFGWRSVTQSQAAGATSGDYATTQV
jgi:hypothetical protein